MIRTLLASTLPAALLMAMPAFAEQHTDDGQSQSGAETGYSVAARAAVQNRDGTEIGTVTINETDSGTPMVIVTLSDIPEGTHGIHIHETGDCSADDFTSAGGHIAGDAQHGVYVSGGPHPGDLPNANVASDGSVNLEIFNDRLAIEDMIFDEDGSAFIVHAGADDYSSQPAGDAGDRIACGVFEQG